MHSGVEGCTNCGIDVLLVDDYSEYLKAGAEYLEEVDDSIAVVTATSAEAALRCLAEESVDCVVCDYKMPGTDGVELLEVVRSEYPDLPFVLLTGQEEELPLSEEADRDVTDVLTKGRGTRTFERLRESVRDAVSRDAGS